VLPLLQAPGTNLPDGRRLIFATAEDVSGNIGNQTQAGAVAQLEIFLDTRGPQITNVFFDPIDPAQALRSVFDPKPLNNTPTPLTSTLRIDVRDLPARFLQPATPLGTDGLIPGGNGPFGFQYPALNEILAEELGNYKLVGDQWGEIEIISATFVSLATADDTTVCPASNGVLPPAGLPGNNSIACGFIELEFDMPLPDDRYTLTIFDRIKDDAGNALDGEANTTSPTDTPNFPSGDGEPGDSFQARFTVDSRPEIGTFCCGSWYVDLNGNGTFDDPNNHDTDFTNGDIVFKFGLPSDFPVVGDWNNDGFDEIGVYGRRADGFRFELDLNGNGTFDTNDISFLFNATGPGAGGRPVAGRWNPGQNGDHVAVFNGTTWIVDVDTDAYTVGAPNVAPDVIVTAARGRPIVADFNGDGDDDAGLFQSTTNTFVLDLNSDDNFQVDTTIVFGFTTIGQLPVAADWDADGDGNIGLFVQDRNGQFPREAAEWYLDLGEPFTGPLSDLLRERFGDGLLILSPANPGDGHFEPPPTGGLDNDPDLRYVFQDIFYQFGDELSEPIVGNFDPPSSDVPVGEPIVRPTERLDDANTIGPNATPLIIWDQGGAATESAAIERSGDRDVFRFTATESGRIAIDAKKGAGSQLDTYLAVYNSSRKRVAANKNIAKGNTDSRVEINVVAGQSYFIEVSGTKRSIGTYSLAVDYLLAIASSVSSGSTGSTSSGGSTGSTGGSTNTISDDHGNTSSAATQLALAAGQSLRSTGSIGLGDVDFFEFKPTVNGQLQLNVGAIQSTLNTAVDVYDASGRLIATNDNFSTMTTDSRVNIDVIAGERYFIRVRGSGNRTGDYAMTIDWLLAQL
jgi:hypothetical protein